MADQAAFGAPISDYEDALAFLRPDIFIAILAAARKEAAPRDAQKNGGPSIERDTHQTLQDTWRYSATIRKNG